LNLGRIGVEKFEQGGVVLGLGRRRTVRDGDDVTESGHLQGKLIELTFNPDERLLGFDVIQAIQDKLALRLNPKVLLRNRPKFCEP
jgi:hypothetical protein